MVNRAQLIDDSFNLARAKHIPYKIPFDFLNYLTHETDYLPWAAADRALSFLHPVLMGSEYYDYFRSMIRYGSNLFYERFGVEPQEGEPPLDILARNLAIKWACTMKHPKCISDTTFLMDRVAIDGASIGPDLKSTIYCNGMRGASANTFETMWGVALKPEKADSKNLILNSLGCSHNSTLLKLYLQSSTDENKYDDSDRVQVILAVYSNGGGLGLQLTLDFLVNTDVDILLK